MGKSLDPAVTRVIETLTLADLGRNHPARPFRKLAQLAGSFDTCRSSTSNDNAFRGW